MGKGVGIGKRQRGIRKSDLSYAFLFRPPFFARVDWVQSALRIVCVDRQFFPLLFC